MKNIGDWADIATVEEGVFVHCIDGEDKYMSVAPFAVYAAICHGGIFKDVHGQRRHPTFWYTNGNYFEVAA